MAARQPCSVAEWFGASFKIDGSNSHPNLVVASLHTMLHDNYLCLVESNKQQIKEVGSKIQVETRTQRQLLSESGFVLRIAPPSLSRDRRIKLKKSINQKVNDVTKGIEPIVS